VPFQAGPAVEWLPKVLESLGGGKAANVPRVLALHLGIQDGRTPPWLDEAHDSVPVKLVQELMQKYAIEACFTGNWHEPRQWEFPDTRFSLHCGRITQVGTLCPTGFDNPGDSFGTMAIYDSQREPSVQHLRVPGPRFLKVTGLVEMKRCVADTKGNHTVRYLRAMVDPEEFEAAEALLSKAKAKGLVKDGEVSRDTAEAQVALRQAAGLARSAETVDGAVEAYVAQMPLEDITLRAEVLARVKGLLGGAS